MHKKCSDELVKSNQKLANDFILSKIGKILEDLCCEKIQHDVLMVC